MLRLSTMARLGGSALLRRGLVRRALLRVARTDLVLVYHRVGREYVDQLVPTISPERLEAHLDVLRACGPVLSLNQLLDRARGARPRFAVTFDDDYASHAEHALATLTRARVHATFFLCGRAASGLGPPWWELLEALIAAEGIAGASRVLGRRVNDLGALCATVENDLEAQRRIAKTTVPAPPPLGSHGIRELVAAGMDVGYHTLHHPLLTQLDDAELDDALRVGRDRLSEEVKRPMEHFAYPHGKATRRVADATRRAGYRAAWTGWPAPLKPDSDPFLLPRWEPGPLDADEFAAALAVRLHRTAAPHRIALRG